jgi:hypothetical protein
MLKTDCGPDFLSDPTWATLAPIDNEKLHGDTWECACGDESCVRCAHRSLQDR